MDLCEDCRVSELLLFGRNGQGNRKTKSAAAAAGEWFDRMPKTTFYNVFQCSRRRQDANQHERGEECLTDSNVQKYEHCKN
jgi:hypothetical protein